MMYDKVLEEIKGLIPEANSNGQYYTANILEKAANAIEELSKRVDESIPKDDAEIIIAEVANPRWIPVTERLPEMPDGENISKEVYVTDGTDIAQACIIRDYDGVTSWSYTGIGEITHWCEQIPLPQPPKEKNS